MIDDKEWLQAEVNKRPLYRIADEFGIPRTRLYYKAKRMGIVAPKRNGYIYTEEERRNKSEAQKRAYKEKYPDGRFADKHPRWKGGVRQHQGYKQIYNPYHFRATKTNPYVFEHILVAEQTLGRNLTKDEVVHHINGDKQDNHPENLEVCKRSEHVHHHFTAGKGIQGLHNEIKRLQSILDENNIKY